MSTFDQFPVWADKLQSTQVHPTAVPKVLPMPVVSFADPLPAEQTPIVRKGRPKGSKNAPKGGK